MYEALGYIFLPYPSGFDVSEIAVIASGDLERDCNTVQQSHPEVKLVTVYENMLLS